MHESNTIEVTGSLFEEISVRRYNWLLKILLEGPHNAQKTVKIQRVVKGGIPNSQQPTVIMLPNREYDGIQLNNFIAALREERALWFGD